ncbi:MAG TPA: hypothetical protein VIY90_09260 [Steroidobacteraceae bacterium]
MDTENKAPVIRVNCGHSSEARSLASVRRYQRDVHSPAIARNPGIYEYCHFSFDPIRPHIFASVGGIEFDCPKGEQFNSVAATLFLSEEDHARSIASPPDDVRPLLVADVPLIQKWTAPFFAEGPNGGHTYIDTTGIAVPQGPPTHPAFGLFLRQRSDANAFRECVSTMARRWSAHSDVRRLRLTLLKSNEAKQAAGDYAIKGIASTNHHMFHAWIDLVIDSERNAMQLLSKEDAKAIRPYVSAFHVYPVAERYTYVYAGRPTLVGLRGYAAYQAINEFHAANERDPRILRWMYGPVVQDGPIDPSST